VYHESILQNIMVVPLGANNITKDIQELGISEINAERLKCLKGVALESLVENPIYISVTSVEVGESPVKISTKFLATIIESRLSEILQPIFETIANLQFELEAGIIVTGGGAKLNGILEFMIEKTGIDARFGDHSDWLSEDTDKKYCDPKYAQLIGTILLTNDYRIEHPLELNIEDPKKKPKIPKSTLIDKLTDRYTSFFGSQSEIKF
jgi:cell division protein FtsA